VVDDGSEKGAKSGDSSPNALGVSRPGEPFYAVKRRDKRYHLSLSQADSIQTATHEGLMRLNKLCYLHFRTVLMKLEDFFSHSKSCFGFIGGQFCSPLPFYGSQSSKRQIYVTCHT